FIFFQNLYLSSARQSAFSASPLSIKGRMAAKGVNKAPNATAAAPRLKVLSASSPTFGSFNRPDTTTGTRNANRLVSLGFASNFALIISSFISMVTLPTNKESSVSNKTTSEVSNPSSTLKSASPQRMCVDLSLPKSSGSAWPRSRSAASINNKLILPPTITTTSSPLLEANTSASDAPLPASMILPPNKPS